MYSASLPIYAGVSAGTPTEAFEAHGLGRPGQATYWNSNTIHTEITQSQNTGSVSYDGDRWIWVRPIPKNRGNRFALLDGNVEGFRVCVQGGILQADISNCWGVHEGHQLSNVVDHEAVEEVGVLLLEGGEVKVFVDVRSTAVDHPHGSLALRFQTL